MDTAWIVRGKLITPSGIIDGAVGLRNGRIVAIKQQTARTTTGLDARGAFVAPGFIDLHVWGDPKQVSREAAACGTTAFLTTVGPAPKRQLLRHLRERIYRLTTDGAECLGVHLEGPFVNPKRAGALPQRGMRAPSIAELQALHAAAGGKIRLITIAPELSGAMAAIRWCARNHIAASLGHSLADAKTARKAVSAGARLVTHVFNGMPTFHHRQPSLVDAALTDERLITMLIADGVHVGFDAIRLLLRLKGAAGVALVTDSIRHQGWRVTLRNGAFYTREGVLAGSRLTLLEAVKNMVKSAGAPLAEAVAMASAVPAGALGLRDRGSLAIGKRADLTAFDSQFRVQWTMIGGKIVYQQGRVA